MHSLIYCPTEPIGHVNVTGNTWLKHGDLVELTVECSGSPNIAYCKKTYTGVYNVTGKLETCINLYSK